MKNYRLLDFGDETKKGDEFLTKSGLWRNVVSSFVVNKYTGINRREDDGKGKYLLSSPDQGATEFWNLDTGVQWFKLDGIIKPLNPERVIWRKEREGWMEKIVENDKNIPFTMVVGKDTTKDIPVVELPFIVTIDDVSPVRFSTKQEAVDFAVRLADDKKGQEVVIKHIKTIGVVKMCQQHLP